MFTLQINNERRWSGRPILIKVLNNFRPKNAESYLCSPLQLDKSTTYFITGFEPTAHMQTAHHMIIYGCKSPGRQEAIYNCGSMVMYYAAVCLRHFCLHLKKMFVFYNFCRQSKVINTAVLLNHVDQDNRLFMLGQKMLQNLNYPKM